MKKILIFTIVIAFIGLIIFLVVNGIKKNKKPELINSENSSDISTEMLPGDPRQSESDQQKIIAQNLKERPNNPKILAKFKPTVANIPSKTNGKIKVG